MSCSEFDIIRRYFTRQRTDREDVGLGIGDDAALLLPPAGHELALTVDTLVAGVHFPEDTPAMAIGHKALAVNLSDLAAMGAEPAWLGLALSLPNVEHAWLDDFAQGFFHLAQAYEAQLVGGDTTRGPLSITVQAMGFVPRGQALRRHGAQPGDGVFVTGTLGDAAAGLLLRQDGLSASSAAAAALLERLEMPTPRVEAGFALRGLASAAIDISDGLAADLGHILQASTVGAVIDIDALPLSAEFRSLALAEAWQLAASAGDDYELCFTLPATYEAEMLARLSALGCACTRIGEISVDKGLHWRDGAGNQLDLSLGGYEHFAAEGK